MHLIVQYSSSDCKPTTAKDPKSPAGSDVSATELHTKIINMDTESDNDDILNKDGTLILTPTKTQADETFVPDMVCVSCSVIYLHLRCS